MTTPLTPADAARLLADAYKNPHALAEDRHTARLRLWDAAPALAEALAAREGWVPLPVIVSEVEAERDALRTDLAEAVKALRGLHGVEEGCCCPLCAFLAAHPQGEQT